MTAVEAVCYVGAKKCPNVFEPITATPRDGETIVLFSTANLRQRIYSAKHSARKNAPAGDGRGRALPLPSRVWRNHSKFICVEAQ